MLKYVSTCVLCLGHGGVHYMTACVIVQQDDSVSQIPWTLILNGCTQHLYFTVSLGINWHTSFHNAHSRDPSSSKNKVNMAFLADALALVFWSAGDCGIFWLHACSFWFCIQQLNQNMETMLGKIWNVIISFFLDCISLYWTAANTTTKQLIDALSCTSNESTGLRDSDSCLANLGWVSSEPLSYIPSD